MQPESERAEEAENKMRDPREPTQARPADAVGRIGTAMTSSVIAGAALGAVRATWSVSANDFCPFSWQHGLVRALTLAPTFPTAAVGAARSSPTIARRY